jgi:hypothetical protein
MKTKSFQKYLEKRLNKDEIAEIERQAQREIEIIENLQCNKLQIQKDSTDIFKSRK